MHTSGTFISFGSEFCQSEVLEPLLLHPPDWRWFPDLLLKGSSWSLEELSKEDWLAKNNQFIARGNHKSANTYKTEFHKIIVQEISWGWMLPLPLSYMSSLSYWELAPVGIEDTQWSELPDGSRKTKFCLMHDQSFEASVGYSVNTWVLCDSLEPLHYGGFLSCLIQYIISIRAHHPAVRILGGKSVFKAAYKKYTYRKTLQKNALSCTKILAYQALDSSLVGRPAPMNYVSNQNFVPT
jgi:hypothetical protein